MRLQRRANGSLLPRMRELNGNDFIHQYKVGGGLG